MPARVYLYNLIGELEIALAALVRKHFGVDQDAIMALLSARRGDKLAETLESQKTGDVETDVVTLLYLLDLVEIVKNTDELRSRLDFKSKEQAKKTLGGLANTNSG